MTTISNSFIENEGDCPNHVMILHQGRFFKVTPFDEQDGKPWDIDKLENVFLQIEYIAETEGHNSENSIGVLTTLERNQWAEVRTNFQSLYSLCLKLFLPKFT